MEEQKSVQKNITVVDTVKVFIYRWWILALAFILGAGAFYTVSQVRFEQKYSATVKVYVDNTNSVNVGTTTVSLSSSTISAAKSLVDLYCEILKTYKTFKDLSVYLEEEFGYQYTYTELPGMVSCGAVNETPIFYIRVTSKNQEEAVNIVNAIARILPDRIKDVIEESRPVIVDEAYFAVKIPNNSTRKTIIGGLIGVAIVGLLIFLFEVVLNDFIDNEEWMEEAFDKRIPCLGVVPDVNSSSGRKYGYKYRYYKKENS